MHSWTGIVVPIAAGHTAFAGHFTDALHITEHTTAQYTQHTEFSLENLAGTRTEIGKDDRRALPATDANWACLGLSVRAAVKLVLPLTRIRFSHPSLRRRSRSFGGKRQPTTSDK